MTGNGNPRAALTPLRTCLLRALLERSTEPEPQRSFGLSRETLRAELRALERWGLVTRRDGRPVPTFLVVTAAEGQRVAARAARSASRQFDHLSARWPEFAGVMQHVDLPNIGLGELAFLLVGNWLLDQSLLGALEQEGSLMPPAPSRPAPGDAERVTTCGWSKATMSTVGVMGSASHPCERASRLSPLGSISSPDKKTSRERL